MRRRKRCALVLWNIAIVEHWSQLLIDRASAVEPPVQRLPGGGAGPGQNVAANAFSRRGSSISALFSSRYGCSPGLLPECLTVSDGREFLSA